MDIDELKKLIRRELKISAVSLSDRDLQTFCESVDVNGSGEIDPEEIQSFIDMGASMVN